MNSIKTEDITYLVQQQAKNISLILSGMISLMNDTDAKVEMFQSQGWFKRMINTITGKNKVTQQEIRQNHDKLNMYMSQAIAELYNKNCIDDKIILSLGTQINAIYADHIQLKQMLGAFVGKLNEKIDSVDNFHMLNTEIEQGVYSYNTPIITICMAKIHVIIFCPNPNRISLPFCFFILHAPFNIIFQPSEKIFLPHHMHPYAPY